MVTKTQLEQICNTCNENIHEGTKYTPHELAFGKLATVPTNSILPDDKGNESYSEYETALFNRIFKYQ